MGYTTGCIIILVNSSLLIKNNHDSVQPIIVLINFVITDSKNDKRSIKDETKYLLTYFETIKVQLETTFRESF